MNEDLKDRLAAEILQCCKGIMIQDALDVLDYAKYFLMNRVVIRTFDGSAVGAKLRDPKAKKSTP